jgi:hypothetical protein
MIDKLVDETHDEEQVLVVGWKVGTRKVMARQQCKVSYLLAASIPSTIGSVSLASNDSGQLVDETDDEEQVLVMG